MGVNVPERSTRDPDGCVKPRNTELNLFFGLWERVAHQGAITSVNHCPLGCEWTNPRFLFQSSYLSVGGDCVICHPPCPALPPYLRYYMAL